MNWIDIAWPVMGAVSLTLGLIHGLVWLQHRAEPAHLAFAVAACAVAAMAIIELLLMRAGSVAEFDALVRTGIVAMAVLLGALIGFVWLYFRAGDGRLALAAFLVHAGCLLPNFLTGRNLVFLEVARLDHYPAWGGGTIAVPVGTPNPWMLLWHLSDAVMLWYFASVIVSLRRPGAAPLSRSRATLLCGALVVFVIGGSTWAIGVAYGWLPAPFMINVPFVGVVVMMSYMLGGDVLRAAQLQRALVDSLNARIRLERDLAVQRDELAHLSRAAMLGEISGSLAHELNQPLTAVLSNAQAAVRFLDRASPDLGEVRAALVEIIDNDKHASQVIQRLRAMLRKEASEFQVLQLNDVVHDVVRLVQSDALDRGIAIELDLAPDLPGLRGDRVQLQQVLLNLAINGFDAMARADERTLRVCSARADDGGVLLSVRDGGRGIDAGDLERVFEPFVTTKAEGMGLGLAVCRTIVEAHQGRLWATRNDGAGSTLHLRLPVD